MEAGAPPKRRIVPASEQQGVVARLSATDPGLQAVRSPRADNVQARLPRRCSAAPCLRRRVLPHLTQGQRVGSAILPATGEAVTAPPVHGGAHGVIGRAASN